MKIRKALYTLPLLGAAVPGTAYAQNISISLYPPLMRIKANPGANVKAPLLIINNSPDELSLVIQLKAFKQSNNNDGTVSYYTQKETPLAESNFLQTVSITDNGNPVKSIYLYPNESKTLDVNFTAPKESADHYFSVIFASKATNINSDDTTVATSVGVASNVLVSVGNTQNAAGIITEFKATQIVLGGPADLTLLVSNTRGNYTTATGAITIYDIFGNEAGQIPLKPTTILGNGSVYMTSVLPQSGSNMIPWNDSFMFGVYRARAVISLDRTTSISSETNFIGLPLVVILTLAIFFIILLNILFKAFKKLNFKEV